MMIFSLRFHPIQIFGGMNFNLRAMSAPHRQMPLHLLHVVMVVGLASNKILVYQIPVVTEEAKQLAGILYRMKVHLIK